MAINQAMCGSYKQEITAGIHFWAQHTRTGSSAIAADTFYIAMFTASRTDANEDPESWDEAVMIDRSIRDGFAKTTQKLYVHRSLQPLDVVDGT